MDYNSDPPLYSFGCKKQSTPPNAADVDT